MFGVEIVSDHPTMAGGTVLDDMTMEKRLFSLVLLLLYQR